MQENRAPDRQGVRLPQGLADDEAAHAVADQVERAVRSMQFLAQIGQGAFQKRWASPTLLRR